MDELELVSFQIISSVGAARSSYIEAIQLAKEGKFDEAEETINQGDEHFTEGHHAHTTLVQKFAGGEKVEVNILLTHAQDQLMSAEAFKVFGVEIIELYKRIK
ncbi:MAG: PTS lactose/cellobiose transporter subunit IIA [Erysipelotrichaceae bacterium]